MAEVEVPAPEGHIYQLLLVDDEKPVLEALQRTLKRAKQFRCDIVTVESAEAAQAEMENRRFDIVISDFKMGGMNGVEFLSWVMQNYPQTLRMLVTASSDIDVAKRAINEARVHSYVEKPWDNEGFQFTVYELLARKSEREEEKITEVDSVKGALSLLTKVQESLGPVHSSSTALLGVPMDKGALRQKVLLEFPDISEFNRFSFSLRSFKNAAIEDVHVFERKVVVSVTVTPEGHDKVR